MLSGRSIDRSTPTPYGRPVGRPPPPESGVLAVGRSLGRQAQVASQCARFVHVGRPVRSTANGQIFDRWRLAVDRPVDRPNPESKCSLAGRPLGRPSKPYGRPVGRPPPPESGVLAVGRPLGRPAQVASQRARSTARAWQKAFWVKKTDFEIF